MAGGLQQTLRHEHKLRRNDQALRHHVDAKPAVVLHQLQFDEFVLKGRLVQIHRHRRAVRLVARRGRVRCHAQKLAIAARIPGGERAVEDVGVNLLSALTHGECKHLRAAVGLGLVLIVIDRFSGNHPAERPHNVGEPRLVAFAIEVIGDRLAFVLLNGEAIAGRLDDFLIRLVRREGLENLRVLLGQFLIGLAEERLNAGPKLRRMKGTGTDCHVISPPLQASNRREAVGVDVDGNEVFRVSRRRLVVVTLDHASDDALKRGAAGRRTGIEKPAGFFAVG